MNQIMVVDINDNPIGSDTYDHIHLKGLLHRFVSIFVFDSDGNLVIQRRSLHKVHGNMLSESVSAHVLQGESYKQTALRKLKEELGLDVHVNEVCKIHIITEMNNWKNNAFVNIFECVYNR